ncbi:MAG: hypothetical protein PHH26_09460, partial [Candidatus Thermoplasmatota archaeon]|nr:hypothetical protein [Candidatus Thermoplasmatota archaeon]
WCPKCGFKKRADKRRSTIEEMKELAKTKGGTCISTEYINNHTKMKWKCVKNHIWEAQPSSIKSGTWCPICARRKKI